MPSRLACFFFYISPANTPPGRIDRIAALRRQYPASAADLGAIGGDGPFVIKPAIKEHFIYATKAKAWKAKNREELATLFERATRITGDGEIMVQE